MNRSGFILYSLQPLVYTIVVCTAFFPDRVYITLKSNVSRITEPDRRFYVFGTLIVDPDLIPLI